MTQTQGEMMLSLLRNMQKFNGEIAALLKTFEKFLAERGFRNTRDASVTQKLSTSIDCPERWTPLWMYRVLEHKDNCDNVIVLNIALDNPDEPERIHEPLILCARFCYAKGCAKKHVDVWDAWDLWFCKSPKEPNHLYAKQDLSTELKELVSKSEWTNQAVEAMQEIQFVAVPLASVVDSKALENKVVRRIL